MPRNRRPVDRTEKRSEIVDAAKALFTDVGYDRTSMARIATDAGVTSTTIYWYFTDKDELLVEVLDRVLEDTLARLADLEQRTFTDGLVWVIGELEKYHRLVDTVHLRATVSASIDRWHTAFHAKSDEMVAFSLTAAGVPDTTVGPMTKAVVLVVEAMLTHPQTDEDKRAVLDVLLRGPSVAAPI